MGCTADGAIADSIGIEELPAEPLAGIASVIAYSKFCDSPTRSRSLFIKEFSNSSQQFAGAGRSDSIAPTAVGSGVRCGLVQAYRRRSAAGCQPRLCPGLLMSHADGAAIGGIGIAVQ